MKNVMIICVMALMAASAQAVTVDIYSGHGTTGGGAPYSGLVDSFTSPDIMFGTNTGFAWFPLGDQVDFGAEITGCLLVEADDIYEFGLSSDDGSMLYIDGVLVVDNGNGHPPLLIYDSTFLTAGVHSFKVEFFEDFGGASGVDLYLPAGVSYTICRSIEKELISGPDEIGIYLPNSTQYVFKISYTGPAALIMDTVPAEFEVSGADPTAGDVDVSPANKKDNDKSATIISWLVEEGSSELYVVIWTRESPGKGHGKKEMTVFKPTSCGILNINNGAMAYQVDEEGSPVLDPFTGQMIPIVGLENGTESIEVSAVCGTKPCAPENLTVEVAADTLSLDWDDVCIGGDPVVYNVYRNGEMIAEGISESEYDDEGLAPEVYCYQVEAEYVGGGPGYESGKSNEACGTVIAP